MQLKMRRRLYKILESTTGEDQTARRVQFFIIMLIVVNVAAMILESVEVIRCRWDHFFHAIEIASVMIFSIEYCLRLLVASESPYFKGRIRQALRPLMVIDLLSVLPFYLPLFGIDLRFLRLARLVRIFRIAKLFRYSKAIHTINRALVDRKDELAIAFFGVLLLLVVASILLYHTEHNAQPEVFSSIPATMWWGVATLTTVGYGDMIPITPLGKILAALISILGIGICALPAGILSAAFIEALIKEKDSLRSCPHCGKNLTS